MFYLQYITYRLTHVAVEEDFYLVAETCRIYT